MKDYYQEYIRAKTQLARLKVAHQNKISNLEKEIEKLRHQIARPYKPLMANATLEELLEVVCRATGVLPSELCSRFRNLEYVRARHLFFYIASRHLGLHLTKIGLFMNRDHSTVIHGKNAYQDYLDMGFQPECDYYNQSIEMLGICGQPTE